jgi:hypothetical protein
MKTGQNVWIFRHDEGPHTTILGYSPGVWKQKLFRRLLQVEPSTGGRFEVDQLPAGRLPLVRQPIVPIGKTTSPSAQAIAIHSPVAKPTPSPTPIIAKE